MATSYRVETLAELREDSRALLQGAIDMHVYASPDPYAERRMDACTLVYAAREAGLAALVLKSHEYPTQAFAWALDQEVEGIAVYGAIALDHSVGGLNPDALDAALRIGTRVVWWPTFDSAWSRDTFGRWNAKADSIRVLDERGTLVPVCHTLLDLMAEHGATLCSGHFDPAETLALVTESRRRGIRSIVSHATSFHIPLEVQQALTERGAFIEQCSVNSFREGGDDYFASVASEVRAVGPEHVVLSTDLGQAANPAPPVGFGSWIERFLDAGFTTDEVRQMVQQNPATALG